MGKIRTKYIYSICIQVCLWAKFAPSKFIQVVFKFVYGQNSNQVYLFKLYSSLFMGKIRTKYINSSCIQVCLCAKFKQSIFIKVCLWEKFKQSTFIQFYFYLNFFKVKFLTKYFSSNFIQVYLREKF